MARMTGALSSSRVSRILSLSFKFLATAVAYIGFGATSFAGNADAYVYQYIPLDPTAPAGCQYFNPIALDQSSRVYGTTDCNGSTFVARYENGRTIIISGDVSGYSFTTGNHHGILGAFTFDSQGVNRASLFIGGHIGIIPGVPAQNGSLVTAISDSGIALIGSSVPPDGRPVDVLYRNGLIKRVDSNITGGAAYGLNDFGVLAGNGIHGSYRYNPWFHNYTDLNPLAGTFPKVFSIHDNGDILGYSLTIAGPNHIGVWKGKVFSDYVSVNSNDIRILLWNESGLIVETYATYPPSDYGGFLIPKPGKRLKLADLVPGLPNWTDILDVNERGDLVGYGGADVNGFDESFLLRRVQASVGTTSARAASAQRVVRRLTAADRHLLLPASFGRALHQER